MSGNIRIEIPDHLTMSICNELVEIQRSAWGMSDLDIIPPWKLFITPQIGNHIIVAYDQDKAVAFGLFSLAQGSTNPSLRWLYLDMIGVSHKYQSHNLGFQIMKRAQGLVKNCGYTHIAWTYDPLEGANANLYIKKLGAIATKYYEDYYGPLTGTRHKGTATDRFWTMLPLNVSLHVVQPQCVVTEQQFDSFENILEKPNTSIGIEVPKNFVEIRDSEPDRAQRIRLATRKIFQSLFTQGYVVNGFQSQGDKNCYIATLTERKSTK